MRWRCAVLFAAACICAPAARAAAQRSDTLRTDSLAVQKLPAVVTTAKRYEITSAESPQRIDVISSADLRRVPALDITDALKKLAAVDVIQYPGLLSGVGIRGFRPQTGGISQRTLVLIDGRPAGAYNLALLDLGMVDRIEVLKGPASALYGSSAMGGAVNIVTRKSADTPFAGVVSSSYGSFRTSETTLRAGGSLTGRLSADLTLRHYDQGSDYRVGNGSFFRGLVGSDSALKIYPDGSKPSRVVPDVFGSGSRRDFTTYRTRSGSLRAGYDIGNRLHIDVQGATLDANDVLNPGDIYTEGTSSDGSTRKNVAHKTGSAGATVVHGSHEILIRGFSSIEATENYDAVDPGSFISFASENNTSGVQLQDVLAIGRGRLLAGADFTRTRAASHRYEPLGVEIGPFNPNSRVTSLAAFAEGRASLMNERLTATLGARLDRITLDLLDTPFRPDVVGGSDTFTALNPSAGLLYAALNGVRIHASAGRAFLAPDAFGRAGVSRNVSQGVASYTIGNPQLAAEHSASFDVGIGGVRANAGLEVDLTYFETHVSDRITRARASFPDGSRPTTGDGTVVGRVDASVNSGNASINGFEMKLAFDLGAKLGWNRSLRFFTNATRIVKAEERTPAVSVDVARFANAGDFDPAEIFDALVFGATSATARIKNVADLSLTGGIEYADHDRFNVRLSTRYVGERLDSDFRDFSDVSDVEYPAFMVADLVAGVHLGAQYAVDVIIGNLTDENHYEKRGYNLPGRTARLRLLISF